MPYEITFLSKEAITPGNCLSCYLHFINMNPNPGEPATGCELSGEFLPDDWDTEKVLWDRCPVIQCVEQTNTKLDKFGKLVRDIRITRSLLLYDMAKTLDISSAELSTIECGRNPVPDWFIPALETHYGIGEVCANTLRFLAKERGD